MKIWVRNISDIIIIIAEKIENCETDRRMNGSQTIISKDTIGTFEQPFPYPPKVIIVTPNEETVC